MNIWTGKFQLQSHGLVTTTYVTAGSQAGINAITAASPSVNYACSDAPISTASKPPGLIHFPDAVAIVTLIYNIPGFAGTLQLTPNIIAQIYLNQITVWNDPQILVYNPALATITNPIALVHRAGNSGTSYIFTDFLNKATSSSISLASLGPLPSLTPTFPSGLNATSSSLLAAKVKATPYSIGYVEYEFAQDDQLGVASIFNLAGFFVQPSLGSAYAAATTLSTLPAGSGDWGPVSVAWAPGSAAWPITSFTYILYYTDQSQAGTSGPALWALLYWIDYIGQSDASNNFFAPLPPAVVAINQQSIFDISMSAGSNPQSYLYPTYVTPITTSTGAALPVYVITTILALLVVLFFAH